MRKTVLRALAIGVVLSPAVAFTQSGKTKPTTATYITKEEVDTVNKNGQGTDRNLKVVDIGHENFTVGIIHRGKTVNGVQVASAAAAANTAPAAGRAGGAAAPAPTPCGRQMATAPAGGNAGGITHDSQTEGYYIVSGGGTAFIDGHVVNGRKSTANPDGGPNGPGCGGLAVGSRKIELKVGDVLIVPPGVIHGWADIPDHVDYLSFRPSHGVMKNGWVNPTIASK